MFRYSVRRVRRNVFWLVLLALVWLLCSGDAYAGALSDRLANFPDWTDKPPTQPPTGDLVYPDWIAGTWELTSTLVDLSAPLAPAIETPGFPDNQNLLNEPVTCEVRFEPRLTSYTQSFLLQPRLAQEEIVADRAFNGLSLAKAYMGDTAVKKSRHRLEKSQSAAHDFGQLSHAGIDRDGARYRSTIRDRFHHDRILSADVSRRRQALFQ